jgi:hypothetical protein
MNAEVLTALENDPPVFHEEKRDGGLFLQMSYNKELDKVVLELQTELESRVAIIDKDKVNEARNHPCLFVDNPASLFKSHWQEPVEEIPEEIKPRLFDQDSNVKDQYPFMKGATHCECCGKMWAPGETGRYVMAEDFLAYLAKSINANDLDEVLTALGDQDKLIVCKFCLKLVTGKDIEF